MNKLKELRKIQEYNHTFPETALTFESNGQEIVDPFMSECLRYEVSPLHYYGEAKVDEMLRNAEESEIL